MGEGGDVIVGGGRGEVVGGGGEETTEAETITKEGED